MWAVSASTQKNTPLDDKRGAMRYRTESVTDDTYGMDILKTWANGQRVSNSSAR